MNAPPTQFQMETLEPQQCRAKVPYLSGEVRVYRFKHPGHGWTLSIATYGEPGSRQLSLGGFRIAPKSRTMTRGYDNDREAIQLAMGMEEKVFWSRLLQLGGPLGEGNLHRIVGGKCVLLPTEDARVGQPQDAALLDFAVSCLKELEESVGILITTGQDLGHGIMSDGLTSSLEYLNRKFPGSMLSNTAMPTGEGNFQILCGGLRALDIAPERARIGLIGCGNVGGHVLKRLLESRARVMVLEAYPPTRDRLAKEYGLKAWAPDRKEAFLAESMDALVVNASGGTLDEAAITVLENNEDLRIVCGCENLAIADPDGLDRLRWARKIYFPTELCGMVGYLTAVEEYLSQRRGVLFREENMYPPAKKLERVGFEGVGYLLDNEFGCSFDEALRTLYGT